MTFSKLSVLLAFVGFTSVLNAQSYLGFNLKVGDSLRISQDSKQEIVQKMNEQEHKIINNLGGDYLFYVKKKTDSSYIIDFKYESFYMKTTSNLAGPIYNVDTKKEISADDIEGQIFKGLTRSSLEINMLKSGKIVNLKGTDSLIEHMIGHLDIDSFTKEVVKESMRKEFGGQSLIESLNQFTYMYPNKKLNIGDTWKNKYTGELTSNNNWTFKASNSFNEITAKSTIALKNTEDNITMILQGTQDTTVLADKQSGWPKEATITSVAKGISIMKDMENVDIPTTITSTTIYKPLQ
ncbi:DUF6263 family protein [Mesoflavibacter profundi]|uniref:DUF6263 family protein n=1 Tax=Mesoflavibacter profundi TaxID=2708110 RepID=UPI00168B7151|nr:DUF6263 family protein [Mesoflavibacter profundi]